MWTIKFTKRALQDKKLLKQSKLDIKTKKILNVMAVDPFVVPPPYETLVRDLAGYYSRRINIKHRIVYKVYEELKTIVIHSMWSHYE